MCVCGHYIYIEIVCVCVCGHYVYIEIVCVCVVCTVNSRLQAVSFYSSMTLATYKPMQFVNLLRFFV